MSPAAADFFRHGELEDAESVPRPVKGEKVTRSFSAILGLPRAQKDRSVWRTVRTSVNTGKLVEDEKDEKDELRHALHLIGIYRHRVTVVSFPTVEYKRQRELV